MSPCEQATQPRAQPCLTLGKGWQRRPGAVDQQRSQILIAAFADAEQPRLAAGGMLSRHKSQPSTQIACSGKGRSVSDSCDERRGVENADPGNGHQPMGGLIVASKFDELPIQCFDAPVEIASHVELDAMP